MTRKTNLRAELATLAAALLMVVPAAHADERTDLETLRQTTLNLIQALVQQGVFTQEKASQLIKQAEAKALETVASQKKAEPPVVRVQLVPEHIKKQIANEVREEVVAQAKVERWGDANAVPEWVDRVKLEGELRVGYQADRFSKNNAPEIFQQVQGQNVTNTTEDRDRYRLRARLGVTARVTPSISAGLRLTTGSLTDPVSTNQTLGNYGNKYGFVLDRAFVRFHSDQTLPWLAATVGRIPNPWFSSDLVWHDDLNFEGAYLGVDPLVGTSSKWRPFGGAGVFPLQDVEQSASVKAQSKMLVGAQVGVEWIPDQKTRAKLGLAYYDFRNVSGIANTFNDTSFNRTAPDFRQKGNTLFNIANDGGATTLYALSADYQLLNLTGVLDMKLFDPAHVIISGDYVKNVGFSQSKTLARTGIDITEPQTTGYMARVAVGMPTMLLKDDWQVSLAYRYLEADAVVDAFTDSSFHLGGTNNKGYILGAQYGLGKNAWMTARWMSSNEIRGLPLSVDVLQLYFNARF